MCTDITQGADRKRRLSMNAPHTCHKKGWNAIGVLVLFLCGVVTLSAMLISIKAVGQTERHQAEALRLMEENQALRHQLATMMDE